MEHTIVAPMLLLSNHFPGNMTKGQCDCDCDCDCACADIPISPSSPRFSFGTKLSFVDSHSQMLDDHYHLMFNPKFGAGAAVLNSPVVDILKSFQSPRHVNREDPQNSIRKLIKANLLEVAEADTYAVGKSSSQILSAWLHITDHCNLRCSYCYLPHAREELTPEMGRTAIDAIFRSVINNGFKQVKLKYAGGEPLSRFPMLVELHQYARRSADQKGLELDGVVLSNGTLLTKEIVESMRSLGLRLMVSLDGLGQYHDCHRSYASGRGSSGDVLEAIETAQALGLTPDISITVSSRNVDGLAEVFGWVLEHDLPFSINFYRENDLSKPHAELALEEQKIIDGMLAAFKVVEANLPRRSLLAALTDRANLAAPHLRTCGVGQNYLVFDTQGRVAKCQMKMDAVVTDASADDPLAVVRADQSGIQNVSVEEKEGCRDCQWRYWCAGGCPLEAHRVTGRYDVRSPHCNIYQAIFPEVLRLEGLRLLKYQDDPEIVQKIEL
jgi:uncharacterized protein